MPPKRKALTEMASNDMAAGTRRGGRNTQSSKISPDASTSNSSAQTLLAPNPSAPKAGGKAQKQTYKYSDPSTVRNHALSYQRVINDAIHVALRETKLLEPTMA